MSEAYGAAMSHLGRIEQLCDFFDNPTIVDAIARAVPPRMPPGRGALGFDDDTWIGLGMVGLWAALDAFAERATLKYKGCVICDSRCLLYRFDNSKLTPSELTILSELEDVRHLYAHNFAGRADDDYFARRRHVFVANTACKLSSGAEFDGQLIKLKPLHLRHYAQVARGILPKFV